MFIKTDHPIRWKLNYVPTYYEGLDKTQLHDQRVVLDFKEGRYDETLMLWFRQNIWKIARGQDYAWSVCFLPCSNDTVQTKRFGKLAHYLKETTRIDTYLSTFGFAGEHERTSIYGKKKIDIMDIGINLPDIFVKNVILIDDVITTGETFNKTAEVCMQTGANSIHGLFLAKTIHPDLPIKKKTNSRREIEEAILREESEIMNSLN